MTNARYIILLCTGKCTGPVPCSVPMAAPRGLQAYRHTGGVAGSESAAGQWRGGRAPSFWDQVQPARSVQTRSPRGFGLGRDGHLAARHRGRSAYLVAYTVRSEDEHPEIGPQGCHGGTLILILQSVKNIKPGLRPLLINIYQILKTSSPFSKPTHLTSYVRYIFCLRPMDSCKHV